MTRPERWRVLLAAGAIQAATYGAQFSFTVFFPALLGLAGGSRGRLSGAYTLFSLVYCSFAVVVGIVADRWSPRRLMMASGLVSSLAELYVTFGIVAGLGMSAGYVVPMAVVLRSFPRRSGSAVGLVSAGIGAGMMLMPPLTLALIQSAGWRSAFAAIGGAVLVVVVTASLALPDARSELRNGSSAEGGAPLSPGAILAAPHFWLLGLVCATSWLPLYAIWGHLFPMGLARGIAPPLAAAAASVFGAAGIAGRIGWGFASDRWGRPLTIAVCLGAQAVAFVALASLRDAVTFFSAVALFGCASGGSVPLLAVLAGDLFGPASAGRLTGAVVALAGLVATFGASVAGLLYDRSGSYASTYVLNVVLTVLALALLAALARRPVDATR